MMECIFSVLIVDKVSFYMLNISVMIQIFSFLINKSDNTNFLWILIFKFLFIFNLFLIAALVLEVSCKIVCATFEKWGICSSLVETFYH